VRHAVQYHALEAVESSVMTHRDVDDARCGSGTESLRLKAGLIGQHSWRVVQQRRPCALMPGELTGVVHEHTAVNAHPLATADSAPDEGVVQAQRPKLAS
jgi:hypothetical protein